MFHHKMRSDQAPLCRVTLMALTWRRVTSRRQAHDRSRFLALALFGRRPTERATAVAFTGIQKPAQQPTHALQHAR